MEKTINRRNFGKLCLAAGAMASSSSLMARAAGGPLVVGTWGGDYQGAIEKYISAPLVNTKGYNTVYENASEAPRKVKLMAERPLPRGSMDIAALTAGGAFDMFKNKALAPIDYSKIANAERIIGQFKLEYMVPQYYTTRVILYNPEKIQTAPTSYADLWKPEYAGKVGVIDIQYQTTIESAAMAFGGSLTDYEPGKKALLDLKKSGVRVYPTNEAMAQALQTGECWICIMWHARGVLWQDAGIPIKIAVPKEGSVVYLTGFSVAANARNADGAYEFLNAELADSAQVGFAQALGGTPATNGVTLPPALSDRLTYSAEQQKNFLFQNNDYLSANDAQLKDWWEKTFKA